MAKVVWWWIKPAGESDASGRPKDSVLISTWDNSQNYNTLLNSGSITYHGKPYNRTQGPFDSKAVAQQAPAGGGSILQQIEAGISAGAQTDVGVIGTGTRAAKAAGKAIPDIASFLSMLTDPNLWIRVVKIIAGGAMLIVGLAKLTGADKSAGSLAGKAVKLAPLL
jgi:hypothetical protein